MSSSLRACWLVTRERDEGQPLVDALVARGVDARALPCIERRALAWPAALTPSPAGRTVVFATSPFAARLVAARARAEAWGDAVTLAAVAPRTVAVLERAGWPVRVRALGGSVALARAVVDDGVRAPVARVLYPTSDAGVHTPEQARAVALLSTVTGDVRRDVVYTTRPAAGLGEALGALSRDAPGPVGLVFFSPSAVRAFFAVAASAAARGRAVCVGASTARAWDAEAGAAGAARAVEVAAVDDVGDLGDGAAIAAIADVVAALDRGGGVGSQDEASMEVRR